MSQYNILFEFIAAIFLNFVPMIAYGLIVLAVLIAIVGRFEKSNSDKVSAYAFAAKTLLIAGLLLFISIISGFILGFIFI